MTNLVRSELLKVRTTRGWYAYLGVIVLLTGLAVAGDVGSAEQAHRSDPAFQVGLVEAAGISALLSIILGITIVTTEFRHGTITPTLLANPRRERVVAGKGIAAAGVAVGFALLALLVAAAVAVIWLSIVGADLHLGDHDVLVRALQTVLLAVLWGLLGIAIGTLVQSQVAALVGTLIWVFIVETLLVGIFGLLDIDGLNSYLPFRALDAADGSGGPELLGYWAGVGVSAAWIVAVGAAGLVRVVQRDIT
jgi:ABC-type transport system involved in multi-copper enzyme maturation permease subunit